jgi:predicted transposase/invertase (TIGR01784 family)
LAPTDNPHDALFRKTFSNPEHAAAELRAVLPPALLARMDLSTLQLASGSYVDAELSSSQSDLLFSVKIQGRPALLYVLFEHQSTVDGLMPFRILKYVVRILDRHIADHGAARGVLPLPVVIPVVLHHSATGWTAPTRMEALFDPELLAEPAILESVPRLGFVLDDISHLSDDDLAARALGLLPTLVLWALRDARRPRAARRSLARWTSVIQELEAVESGLEALLTIFRYLFQVAQDLAPQTLLATLATTPQETKDALMTTMAERWIAEGEAKGEAKGRIEERRMILLELLTAKFGELPEHAQLRIQTARAEVLWRWMKRYPDANSLESVFSD